MKLVIFGLTVSSSWGNGHATLWRGLIGALHRLGHEIVFFERDVPYYAANRDLTTLPGGRLVLYDAWADILPRVRRELADADVALVTSYCPDGAAAGALVCGAGSALTLFYDMDTPVTLARVDAGERVSYLGPDGLAGYDLVLSYTGGPALAALERRLGARRVGALYGSVDPALHRPAPPVAGYRADLSYLGTYAEDRQEALDQLLVAPARALPGQRFLIAGAQYPPDFPWTANIFFVRHLPPTEHPAFFGSSRLTLNVTRAAMARMGWCPSGRLFEAAACGAAVLSDAWEGLEQFLTPGAEILIARSTADAIAAMSLSDREIRRVAEAARARVLGSHTADHRAGEMLASIDAAWRSRAHGDVPMRPAGCAA